MNRPPTWYERSMQKLRDLMKRDGYTWQTHPSGPAHGMWVPPWGKPDWERGCVVYPVEVAK